MHSTPFGLSSFFLFGWRFLAAFSLGASSPRLMLSSHQSTCGLSLHTAGCFLTPNCPADCTSTLLCRIGCFFTPNCPSRLYLHAALSNRRIGGGSEGGRRTLTFLPAQVVCALYVLILIFGFLSFFLFGVCCMFLFFAFFLWWQ